MEKSNLTSPAEELRAAATLIRETVSRATPGPWTTQEVPDEVYVEIMAGTEVAVAHAVSEDRGGCDRPLNGPDGHRRECFDHALAIARSILGRTS